MINYAKDRAERNAVPLPRWPFAGMTVRDRSNVIVLPMSNCKMAFHSRDSRVSEVNVPLTHLETGCEACNWPLLSTNRHRFATACIPRTGEKEKIFRDRVQRFDLNSAINLPSVIERITIPTLTTLSFSPLAALSQTRTLNGAPAPFHPRGRTRLEENR